MDKEKLERWHAWRKDKNSARFKRFQIKQKIRLEKKHRRKNNRKNKTIKNENGPIFYCVSDSKTKPI